MSKPADEKPEGKSITRQMQVTHSKRQLRLQNVFPLTRLLPLKLESFGSPELTVKFQCQPPRFGPARLWRRAQLG
jgi:hypothetical protein